MRARWIFASFDTRRQRGRYPQPERPTPESRLELSKEEASVRGFEAKPKLENANPLRELAIASLVLPGVKAPIVEGPKPPLSIAA
jgi:hypothetical protein